MVTGGSAGLGRAILAHAPRGSRRVDVSRSGPSADDDVENVVADLADPASWAEVGARIAALVAPHDGDRVTLVHNAGTLDPVGFAGEVDGAAYARQVLLNGAAPQALGHHLVAALAAHGATRRELVQISSGAARTAYPGWSAYNAAKAGVEHWVRTVDAERRDRDPHDRPIRVVAVRPGVVATAMQDRIRSTAPHDFPRVGRFQALHDDGELRDPDDVARDLWALLETVASDRDLGPVVDLRDHPREPARSA